MHEVFWVFKKCDTNCCLQIVGGFCSVVALQLYKLETRVRFVRPTQIVGLLAQSCNPARGEKDICRAGNSLISFLSESLIFCKKMSE